MKDYITTYTGKHFTVAEPKEEDIDINDIAHALSMLSRANGHFSQFYSVGQHSVDCAYEAIEREYSMRVALACLLHDASEAYLCDIPRPIKNKMPEYLKAEEVLQNMIYEKFLKLPLSEEEQKQVSSVDDALLFHEFKLFTNEELDLPEHEIMTRPSFNTRSFSDVEEEFMLMFHRIQAALGNE
ncbi:MAG: phosphohydrolase [Lachnospiraceae bacterium]|nr:phosphohydrolase [Lachnospiraceae bacterium]MDD6192018.1 phosphohydrolase [Lachnospiraceae bacterium]MDY4792610.1 phosphohydrolase [Pararoseburia sp.]